MPTRGRTPRSTSRVEHPTPLPGPDVQTVEPSPFEALYARLRRDYPPLLTVEECSDLLRMNKQTLYALIKSGQLNAVRAAGGRMFRLVLDDVIDFIERSRVSPSDVSDSQVD